MGVTGTGWLSEEEMRAWLAYIDLSTLLGDYLDRQLKRDAGLPHLSYHLLSRLSAAPGRSLRLSELAERLKITRGRLSHLLDRMEERGLVSRDGDPADRRGQLAVLTGEGFEVIDAAAPGHVAAVRRAVFDHLTPEQVQQFAEIAETITGALTDAEKGSPSRPAELPWRRR